MAVNPTKLLPPSGGALAVRSKTIDIGKKKEGGIEGQVLVIRTQVIKIEKLITRGYTLKLKEQKEERKENENKKRAKKEEELETKKPPKEGKGKIPSLPRLGFLDRIRKFIGNMLLAYFAVRLIDHLPKLIPFVKAVGNVAEFLIDVGGGILNGLVSFIDWGYKAYDATRGFIKNLGGENFAKVFDGFNSAIGTLVETAITAAIVLASQGEGGVLDVGKDIIKDKLLGQGAKAAGQKVAGQAAGQAARTAGMGAGAVAGIVAGAGLLASALGEGAFQVRKVAVKPIQNLENEFNKDRNPITKIGRGIILTMVRPLYGLFSTVGFLLDVVGAPFRYAIELLRYPFLSEEDKIKQANNLAKFDARIREDLRKAMNMLTLGLAFKEKGSFGNIYGNKGSQKEMMNKMAGGGITRGGKKMGAIRRTGGVSGKGKIKRKTKIAQKPREVEFKSPGADIGGEDKLFGIFPKPKIPDAVNPFKAIENTGKTLGKSDYFGPILAITSKITLGQKPSEQDYKNVGLGINLLFNEGMNKGQLIGGVAAAYAEGGFVDKKTLEAVAEGGDITNWVAGAFKEATETNAQKTLREIRENAKKKKTESSETPPPSDIDTDGGGTSGGGTADTSLNPYRRAFLDTLAFAEGTSKYPNTGYNTMFTGKQFSGYKDHPRQIQVSGRYRSDAAGRYQFLSTTWDGLGLPDFSPANQDKGALKLLAPHVLTAIDKGDFATAFHGARKTWASLPGAGYGQPEKKMKTLVEYANTRLSKYKKGEIGKPIIDEIDLKDLGDVKGYRVTRSGATIKNYSELPPHHTYQTTSDGRRVQDFTLYKGKDFVNVPVPSPVSGKVTWTGNAGNGGNWVEIQSNEGKVELGHFNKISAKVGQSVQAFKSVLGLQGYTGRISPSGPDGTHVHIQASDKVIGRYVNSLARGSAFHGENFGVVPKDGFMLRLHKGEMYKVIDKDSVDLLGFDLTKEIIDIENKSQLIAKAPSIIEKLKAISGYASYESEAPQTVIVQDTPEQDSYQDPMVAVIGGGSGGGDSYDPFAMLDRLSG